MIIFQKTYDEESLYDLPRDVSEAVNTDYNPIMDTLPSDGLSGFSRGVFHVKIEWTE